MGNTNLRTFLFILVTFTTLLPSKTQAKPKVTEILIESSITSHFARTNVVSKISNAAGTAEEATFVVILPESAYISDFTMEIDGKNYTTDVEEKVAAADSYKDAVSSGFAASHVAVSERDCKRFSVSINIEAHSSAIFYLVYEQLLDRKDDRYELVINVQPEQPAEKLSVKVLILDKKKIIDLDTPINLCTQTDCRQVSLDPREVQKLYVINSAIVQYSLTHDRLKELAQPLIGNTANPFTSQFVVKYDVEGKAQGGTIYKQGDYFVHFYAPSNLVLLRKYVVFVLDTSLSMKVKKLDQLKDAMYSILNQLGQDDLFSLVEFQTNVKVWDLDGNVKWYPESEGTHDPNDHGNEVAFNNYNFPNAHLADTANIQKAKQIISQYKAKHLTDIYNALKVGLRLVEIEKSRPTGNVDRQPIIVFLTDGYSTRRLTNKEDIINRITNFNVGIRKAPIFTLAFGPRAEYDFLKTLALKNNGSVKQIYEAKDAAMQLQDYYKQIASPALSSVTFSYNPPPTQLSKTDFPLYFSNSELVVVGRGDPKTAVVKAKGAGGPVSTVPTIENDSTVLNIERLWAYLMIRNLLENTFVSQTVNLKQAALDLSRKYKFVTPVTSLVVVKAKPQTALNILPPKRGKRRDVSTPGNVQGGPRIASKQKQNVGTFRLGVDVKTDLPWINDFLVDGDMINLNGEDLYYLGLDDNSDKKKENCTEPPYGNNGYCSLLHRCPQIYNYIWEFDEYIKYFCVLEEKYAGVCCPN